jgi:acyl carrier protein
MSPYREAKAVPLTAEEDRSLRMALKRFPPRTYDAVRQLRITGDPALIGPIVDDLFSEYTEQLKDSHNQRASPSLRLSEDLGIDSLTLMEILFLAEDVLQFSINDEDLRRITTLGEVRDLIESKFNAPVSVQSKG